MKKIIGCLTALVMCVCLIPTLSACGTMYSYKSGTIEELVGTYELTAYDKKDINGELYSFQQQNEVVAYMVVGADGFGYYVYKDKNTALKYDSTIFNFAYDEENELLIKSLEVQTGGVHSYVWEQKPGCGDEPKMGFNVNTHTLSYTISQYRYKIGHQDKTAEYAYVCYTKISDKTDLSTVREKLNKNETSMPNLIRYELKNIKKPLIFSCSEFSTSPNKDKYKYLIVDVNSLNAENKVNVYYMLNSDMVARTDTATVKFNSDDENETNNDVVFTVLDNKFNLSFSMYKNPGNNLVRRVMSEPDNEGTMIELYSEFFEQYAGEETTVQEIIDKICAE